MNSSLQPFLQLLEPGSLVVSKCWWHWYAFGRVPTITSLSHRFLMMTMSLPGFLFLTRTRKPYD